MKRTANTPTLHPNNYSLKISDWVLIVFLSILATILRYCVVVLIVLCGISRSYCQPRSAPSPFFDGETLQYRVKWGFVRLGTVVTIQQKLDSARSGQYMITMHVRSAKGLPFLSLHFVNMSLKSPDALQVSLETIMTGEDSCEQTIYRHDVSSAQLHRTILRKGSSDAKHDSLTMNQVCYDALGLFAMARQYSGSVQSAMVATLNDFSVKETEIHFTNDTENIEVSALEEPVRVHRLEGVARWVGNSFAGMKGPFTGWISDDDAAVPVKAELKIVLGSIVLELEHFSRPGWRPRDSADQLASQK